MIDKNNVKDLYLKEIDGFIEYFIELVEGKVLLNHSYYDRSIRKDLTFSTFSDALEQYHWAKGDYEYNAEKLKEIEKSFSGSETDKDFYNACERCLEWGAGGKKGKLYTANIKKLEEIKSVCVSVKDNIEEASKLLTNINPDLSKFGKTYWMNAGFTKIYSLCNDNFIIYDGRVGAALGFIVSKYGLSKEFDILPAVLQFPYGNAQGKQHRNPSIPNSIYKFTGLGNDHKKHALWNIRANWLLEEVVRRLNDKSTNSVFSGIDGMRKIEAALFMIGYDFPELSTGSKNSKISLIKTTNTIKQKAPTKKEVAIGIFNKHNDKTRAQIIELFIQKANLTKAGANTYYQNCKSIWR